MCTWAVPLPKLRPWRRLREEAAASYRIMDIWRVELEDGSGRGRGDAFTVRCRDWCNVIAVTPEDAVVLIWQYRFGTDALSLEIPGGIVDPSEDFEVAARRELLEETGFAAEHWSSLLCTEPNPAIQNNRCTAFLARGARPSGATRFDAQEEIETVLVPVWRIPDVLDGGQMTHSLSLGALEKYWRKRSSGVLERNPESIPGE